MYYEVTVHYFTGESEVFHVEDRDEAHEVARDYEESPRVQFVEVV